VGTKFNFIAKGHYSDGSIQILTSSATWSSSNTTFATVNSGVVSAMGQGSIILTANIGSISTTATFTVLPPAVSAITITPGSATVLIGANQPFTATGKYTDGSTQDLTGSATWTSSNTAVATVSGGIAAGVATGAAAITAASGSVSGRVTLTVIPALSSISVSPATVSVGQGGSQAFTATGHFSDGSSQNLTSSVSWSSSNTVWASINSSGVASALGQGAVTITAASGSISGSASLTVTAPTLTSITVSPGLFGVPVGANETFIAIGHYTDGSSPTLSSVSWSSSNTAIATINSNGVASGVAAGTVTITAASGGVAGTGSLIVTGGAKTLTSIAISPATATIALNGTQPFTATGLYSDGSTQNLTSSVTWSSSNTTLATINSSGAASGVAQGSVTITAASGSISGTASLTVSSTPTITSITVSPSSFNIPQATTQSFNAIGHYSDGTSQDITTTVSWSCSNPAVATVSTSGVATGVAQGSVTITAASGSVTGTASLTVIAGFSINPRVAVLTFSGTAQFIANGNVNWSVDGISGGNPTVGTISSSGLYTPPATVGSHTVTASGVSNPGMTGTATVFVSNNPGVFTYHYDNGRTGQNLIETVLTPQSVNYNQFGKLYAYTVDGDVYAQPLYEANLIIPSQGTHNVVYVATENDSVYAFDADGLSTNPLWRVSFISPVTCDPANCVTPVPYADVLDDSVKPVIGILSTPAIDTSTNTLYVVAYTKETTSGVASYVYRLHALDVTTGAEKFGGPVAIQGSVSGTGADSKNNIVPFIPKVHNQRSGLLLLNGLLYVGFASHGDSIAWHGWVMAYDAQTLLQTAIYNTTANGVAGGIWQSGDGPAADPSGSIFFSTGNGTFDGDIGGVDRGDSILKLSSAGGLSLSDWFTPYNQLYLSQYDQDLGSGGVMLLPDQAGTHPHLLVAAGKQGSIYLLDRDNMGHYNSTADTSVQTLTKVLGDRFSDDGMFSTPAYWQNAAGQEYLYFQGEPDYIKAFQFLNGLLSTSPTSQSTMRYLFPGSVPVVSANGGTNGILWSVQSDSFGTHGPAILRAFDANNLANEFYDSTQAGSRDVAGAAIKFSVPTVANGRVYVGGQAQLTVYGLLP